MSLNLNDSVWVRLTPQAKNLIVNREYLYAQESDGWSKWQLWVLMNEFGPHMVMGFNNQLFENNEISLVNPLNG
ncbi:hypothetical protein Lepto7375DRAFT_7315 [Leptolyngbya sp. PCC 7375]|nr:hypothetical protein Lepto7375DRAFT_7315 [Leptolyngbya sp. PCC 7375]